MIRDLYTESDPDTECHLPLASFVFHQLNRSSSFPSDMDLNLYLSLRMVCDPNETKSNEMH